MPFATAERILGIRFYDEFVADFSLEFAPGSVFRDGEVNLKKFVHWMNKHNFESFRNGAAVYGITESTYAKFRCPNANAFAFDRNVVAKKPFDHFGIHGTNLQENIKKFRRMIADSGVEIVDLFCSDAALLGEVELASRFDVLTGNPISDSYSLLLDTKFHFFCSVSTWIKLRPKVVDPPSKDLVSRMKRFL